MKLKRSLCRPYCRGDPGVSFDYLVFSANRSRIAHPSPYDNGKLIIIQIQGGQKVITRVKKSGITLNLRF